jgi:hypothetical protein
MLQSSILNNAMELRNHSEKNEASPKSQTSRGLFLGKGYFLTIIFACFCAGLWGQTELNTQQKKLQNDIVSYLRTEGFAPSIDEDGDIMFKREGITHYVIIDRTEDSPYFLILQRGLNIEEGYDKQKVLQIANEVNYYKGIKVRLYDTSISIRAEMFLQNAEHFKAVFYRIIALMNFAKNEFQEEYNK